MRYQCNPNTTVRAKVNSAGMVQACAVNKCAEKVSVTVTAAVSARGTERYDMDCCVVHETLCAWVVPPRAAQPEREDGVGGRAVV